MYGLCDRKARLVTPCTAAGLALASEAGILSLMAGDAAVALVLHGCVVLLLAMWARHAAGDVHEQCLRWLLMITVAATGPFGAVICWVAGVVHDNGRKRALSPEQWLASLLPPETASAYAGLHERLTFGLERHAETAHVQPFQDILTGGTILQKQMAIARIARHFHVPFTPLLRQAVRDENPAVRVQAATALARIERDFTARCIRLEKELAGLPAHRQCDLAQVCDEYAHTGLLDENGSHALRMKAAGIYEACLAQEDTPDLRLKLARLYLRLGRPEEACRVLRETVESGTRATPSAVLWYLEALFRLNRIVEVRRLTRRYAHMLMLPAMHHHHAEIDTIVRAWKNEASMPLTLKPEGRVHVA